MDRECVCVFFSSVQAARLLLLLVTVDECEREPCSQVVLSQVCLSVKQIRVLL